MFLDEILERNRKYVSGREARPLPLPGPMSLIVLACFDPRLDAMLLPALGLEPHGTFLFRTAGAQVPPDGALLRSLLVAVFFVEAVELLVVGHTSCRMASFETASFIESFRRRGVSREAFGTEDLRSWAGAIPSPRRGVELSVKHIVSAPVCPPDLQVSGLLLDDRTGALEIVAREAARTRESLEGEELDAPQPDEEKPDIGEEAAIEKSSADLVDDLAHALRDNAKWRYELDGLRQKLEKERNPLTKLNTLVRFVRRAGKDSPELVRAFERLTSGRAPSSEELARFFQQLVTKL